MSENKRSSIKIERGILKEVRPFKTKKGVHGATAIIQLRSERDETTKEFGPSNTIAVDYYNNKSQTDRVERVLALAKPTDPNNENSSCIGRLVAFSYNKETSDGKDMYFGRCLPTTYGLLSEAATIRDDVTEDDFATAMMCIDDCIDSGELPEDEMNFADAKSIARIISVLSASSSTVAKEAVVALRKLIFDETNAYIGHIGFVGDIKRIRNVEYVRVSFAQPGTGKKDAKGNQVTPPTWCVVTFFNEVAHNVKRFLKPGSYTFFLMEKKDLFQGNPSYRGKTFWKIND